MDNDSDKYSRILTEETDGVLKYHVYGHGLIGTYDVNGSFETNHYDYRGSVTGVTDESGVLVGEVTYDEYGVVTSKDDSVTTRFLYNGKYGVQTDSNGLYYMRARYYNPDLKRFMNRDVVSGSIIELQSLNRYAFVNGNPISYNDPFGLAREAINNTSVVFRDWVHLGLDGFGLIPGIGEIADGANSVLYLSEGDYTNASLSAAAMIPFAGSGVTVGKHVVKNADGIANFGKKGYNGIKDSKPLINNRANNNANWLKSDLQFFGSNGSNLTRNGAFRDAKRRVGIPNSNQHKKPVHVYDGTSENRWVYEFDVDGKTKYVIEHMEDKFGRGPHFHGADGLKGSPLDKGRYKQYPGHSPEDFTGYRR